MSVADADPLVPWLAPQLHQLLQGRESLHHALLLHGPAGIGKRQLAWHLCTALLCEQISPDQPLACGQCPSCNWMGEASHPDCRLVLPEAMDADFVPSRGRKASSEIKIEQVRRLARFLAVGAHRAGWRIVLIYPAHTMNYVTANSLLKTLEEPGSQTLLVLVSDRPDRLTPTIRSRCRQVSVSPPTEEVAIPWLCANGFEDEGAARAALSAAGSPMHAMRLADPARATAHRAILEALSALPDTEPLRAVDALDKHDPILWGDVLQRWISDLTRVCFGARPVYFPAWDRRLDELAARTGLDRLTSLQSELTDLTARIEYPLNARLICETTVLAYRQAFETSGRAQ